MSMFASKIAFVELGLEVVAPSTAHMYQDCHICKDPLDVNIHTTASEKHHAAVLIGMCGHMYGQECLRAWLDVGNSCPTCKRLLFEKSGCGVSQSDINGVVHAMRRVYGEKRIMAAITRLAGKLDDEQVNLQRIREDEVRKLSIKAEQEDLMDDHYWMDSGEEDFGEDEEDEDSDMGGDQDDDGIVVDEEVEPQTAKA